MVNFSFNIPSSSGDLIPAAVQTGQLLFILGANGTGKSALVHLIYTMYPKNATIVLAHRPLWMEANSAVMSSQETKTYQEQIAYEITTQGRTQASQYSMNRKLVLVKLVRKQVAIDRALADAARNKDASQVERLLQEPTPIQIINHIFKNANIPIVISVDETGAFFASKNGSPKYSITELSDGEKNVFLLCADVLTAADNSLIIFDEPERHLHRSIIVPLISSLIELRKDCAFIVATHDLELPVVNPGSAVILVRDITTAGGFRWTVDVIPNSNVIPDNIKTAILGARKKVVFVEGKPTSRDRNLYQLLFPEASIECKESCIKVERAVEGVRDNPAMTWVEAFGIIDADDRTPVQIATLEAKGVFALPAYSVEYLYYNPDTVRAVADYYAPLVAQDANTFFNNAQGNIIANMQRDRDRLCARVCEKRIGERIMRQRPTWRQIMASHAVAVNENTAVEFTAEATRFDAMVAAHDINGLLTRYPFRESKVIAGIVAAFGFTVDRYEEVVRKLVLDEPALKANLLTKLGNIVTAIAPPAPVVPAAGAPVMPAAAAAAPNHKQSTA